MKSKLVIVSVEKLQSEIVSTLLSFEGIGVYVSLNKTQKGIINLLEKNKVDTKKLFFVDCVGSNKEDKKVIQVSPSKLDELGYAINSFLQEIKGDKFLIIDALSTLMIYNNENQVAAFVRKITKYASNNEIELIAFSPKTKGEEFFNKIFNFFDEVVGK